MLFLQAIISCAVWLLYTVAAWALGARVLRLFPSYHQDPLLNPALGTTLGLGILGTLWSLIAVAPNGLQALTVLPILIIGLIVGGKDVYSYIRNLNIRNAIPENKWLRFIAAPLVAFLLLTPLMSWHYLGTDALAFYFAQAKLTAYNQGFVPLPGYEAFSQIALPAEFTYAALMTLGPELAARMITSTQILAIALLIMAISRDCGAKIFGQWLALAIILSSTAVTLLSSDGKTDLYGGMLGLATLYVFLHSKDLSKKQLLLMGTLAGFAAMAKLSALPLYVCMLPLILLWRLSGEKSSVLKAIPDCIIAGIIISIPVLLNALPLILKNFVFFDEPFAPFYFLDSAKNTGISEQVWFSPENTAWILKTYPLVWTFGQYPMQHGTLSPLVWCALPALLFVSWKNISWRTSTALILAASGLVGMIVWAIFFPSIVSPRYIFPALFAFIPLAVIGLETIWEKLSQDKYQRLALALIFFMFAFVPIYNSISEAKRGLKVALRGPENSGISYVYQGLGLGEAQVSEQGRILLLGWERAPFSGRNLSCMGSYLDIDMSLPNKDKQSDAAFWESIRKQGYESIVVNVTAGGMKELSKNMEESTKPKWLKLETTIVNNFYTVHQLVVIDDKSAPQQEKRCEPDDHGIWKTTSIEKN